MTEPYRSLIWPLAALLAPLAACGSSSTSVTTEPHPSILEVSPEEFSDNVPCAAGGGLRVYVATLFDVTPPGTGSEKAGGGGTPGGGGTTNPEGGSTAGTGVGGAAANASSWVPFALPSSLPTRCEQAVGFGWIVYGRSYYATVDGYDRDDLDVLAPGVPILVDRATREPQTPRWRATCASPEKPITAESQITRRIPNCTDFVSDTPQTPSRIRVGLEDALGDNVCGTEPSSVASFSVHRAGEWVGSAACGETLVLEEVRPGEFVSLSVLGYESGATVPRFGTTCTATALSGVTLEANCEPFSETGTLAVNLETALDAIGGRCDASLDSLLIELGPDAAQQLTFGKGDCRGTARFFDLAPGEYPVTVTARVNAGEPRVTTCGATVEPGLSSEVRCEKL